MFLLTYTLILRCDINDVAVERNTTAAMLTSLRSDAPAPMPIQSPGKDNLTLLRHTDYSLTSVLK